MMTTDEAIQRFEKQLTDARVVLDSGFGTREGESDMVYRHRKEMAEIALAALRRTAEMDCSECIVTSGAYEASGQHIRDLLAAEEEGRLAVLPIPIGEGVIVYGIREGDDIPTHIETIECDRLDGLEIWPTGELVVDVDGWEIGYSDIGKTVFLTRQEAEAALGGGEGD